jgi:epoxyqueuosine reductase
MANSTSDSDPRERIRSRALCEGFDVVRFAAAESPAGAAEGLDRFLADGHHGTMTWMQASASRRADPKILWPEARSVIVVGVNYAPNHEPRDALLDRAAGAISVYAGGDDYHDLLKKKLRVLASFIASEFSADVKLFVDTAPVMEKPLAQAAGLGWQGKHTNLVSQRFGSWLFLGSIFTTLALKADEAEQDHCGSCRQCLDVCPTDAFPAPYKIDARRCISYLTIELKGTIPSDLRPAIGNRIYGCDDCLAVCPWNKFAIAGREARLQTRAELRRARLRDLVRLDDLSFRELFRGSPIKRIGRDRFIRNVLIAIGNSKEPGLIGEAERLLGDDAAIVRAMAVWALMRLVPKDEFSRLASKHAPHEADPSVLAEWVEASP